MNVFGMVIATVVGLSLLHGALMFLLSVGLLAHGIRKDLKGDHTHVPNDCFKD